MPSHANIRASLQAQPLFEDKTWQLSPEAWPLTASQVQELEAIGEACLAFHQALEQLYQRSLAGKSLLRNRQLLTPWVADYLDRGKPAFLVEHARDKRNRGAIPAVLRPDLLLTEDGWAMTELDSVPGGIGLTAFLNRLYQETDTLILGERDGMMDAFYAALAGLAPQCENPLIALAVSEEANTYRPEMDWLAAELRERGHRVHCVRPDALFPLGDSLCMDLGGSPEKVNVLYRFFELFDLANISTLEHILDIWKGGEVVITPPMRHFQEEKLSLALFHHHLLQDFWKEQLGKRHHQTLFKIIPKSWILDPTPLPPGAVLDGPKLAGRAMTQWQELSQASQKERELIIKISGYHETAWGARSVLLGSDCSKAEWQFGVERAIELAPSHLHILQEFKKPRRVPHPLFDDQGEKQGEGHSVKQGRLRLCPYYFVSAGKARLSGALATFCPPDKKIIHGMQDAALLPCRVVNNP